MTRLHFIIPIALTLFTASVWPQSNKMPVVGVLMISAGPDDAIFHAMRAGLRERGYVQNRDYRIEHRSALGQIERIPPLARELVALKVDVIVVALEPVVRTVKAAVPCAAHRNRSAETQATNRPLRRVRGEGRRISVLRRVRH